MDGPQSPSPRAGYSDNSTAGALPAPPPQCPPQSAPQRWRPRRRITAEACPEDYESADAVREQHEAAADVSVIEPGRLYLSSYRGSGASAHLKAQGVTHVLCLDEGCRPKHPEEFVYLKMDRLEDDRYADVLSQLPEALAFLQRATESAAVLVHCEMGRSRSASVVIAWLMLHRGMSLSEAWRTVQRARPIVSPNPAFRRQLRLLDMMRTTVSFESHPLFKFHLAERAAVSSCGFWDINHPCCPSTDPALYCAQGAGGAPGLACSSCGRIVSSPLNLLPAPANSPASSTIELTCSNVSGLGTDFQPGASVSCGCGAVLGTAAHYRPAAEAGALLPQWCTFLSSSRVRPMYVVPKAPAGSSGDARAAVLPPLGVTAAVEREAAPQAPAALVSDDLTAHHDLVGRSAPGAQMGGSSKGSKGKKCNEKGKGKSSLLGDSVLDMAEAKDTISYWRLWAKQQEAAARGKGLGERPRSVSGRQGAAALASVAVLDPPRRPMQQDAPLPGAPGAPPALLPAPPQHRKLPAAVPEGSAIQRMLRRGKACFMH
eukprot:TRINITY_DN13405_c1_g4_i1.p1 TRINITY_DN13405_c1_g4~~TRINITY_DN13405_c1_g4_i1.p1  ORF type:complete len:544 (+),score=129.17 TRINITY_DN13405_c1_g4_i1:99-1730(+)